MKKLSILTILLISQFSGAVLADECIEGDCVNGQGTFTYTNGDKYVGKWKDGVKNGEGTFTYASGFSRNGLFENGICKYACTGHIPDSAKEPKKEKPLVGIQCDEDHRAVIYGFEYDPLVFKSLRTLQKIPEERLEWYTNTDYKRIFTYRNFDGFQDSSVYNPLREVLDAALVFDDAHANYEILKEYKYGGYVANSAKTLLKNRKKPYRYMVSRVNFSIIHSHPTFQMAAGSRVQMKYKRPEDYFWGGISLEDDSNSCVQKDAEELAAYMDAHDKELKEESEQYKQDTLKKRKF